MRLIAHSWCPSGAFLRPALRVQLLFLSSRARQDHELCCDMLCPELEGPACSALAV